MADAARTEALRTHVLGVATQAARNVGGTVREVARRKKSQAYLYGSLRRRFPESTEDELRATLHWLRHDAPDEDFTTEPRSSTKGRECSDDRVWHRRADRLVDIVAVPLEPEAVLLRAETRLDWRRNFTIQTLAFAETAGLLEWVEGLWQRVAIQQPAPAIVADETQPEEAMTVAEATPAVSVAAEPSTPAASPNETPAERKKRKKREWLQRKRAAHVKPNNPPPTAPAPLPAAATLDDVLEQRVRQLVRAELRAELAKTLGDLVGKVLAA